MQDSGVKVDEEYLKRINNAAPLRNHGLFSKAEVLLNIAGWSEAARRDLEIFVLEDSEGLTPLLMVLNDAYADNGDKASQAGKTDGAATPTA